MSHVFMSVRIVSCGGTLTVSGTVRLCNWRPCMSKYVIWISIPHISESRVFEMKKLSWLLVAVLSKPLKRIAGRIFSANVRESMVKEMMESGDSEEDS